MSRASVSLIMCTGGAERPFLHDLHGSGYLGKPSPHSERIIYRRRRSTAIAPEETVSPFTSAQCLAIVERKMAEAKNAPRHGKELEATAAAWLVLAGRVAEAEALKKETE